jgi:hypothetical protein
VRTILRLCLVASLVASIGLAAVPAAEAKKRSPGSIKLDANIAQTGTDKRQNRRIRRARRKAEFAHKRIANLKEFAFGLEANNIFQQGLIDQIVAGVPQIVGGLAALEQGVLAIQAVLEGEIAAAFEDIEDAFGDIEDALNDSTTGLVGLNNARPLVGAVSGGAAVPGSQFTVADGPTGSLVLRFERPAGSAVNVSARSIQLTPIVGTDGFLSAVTCINPVFTAACNGILGGGPATNADVLVNMKNTGGAAADLNFQVAAISG